MAKQTNTKDRLITAARSFFLGKGYAATTVDELCAKADVSKGNFYHFFKNKEDLGVAALEAFHQGNGEILLNGPFREETDPTKRAFRFLDHVETSARTLWGEGCLLGTYAIELSEQSPRIQKEVSRLFDGVAGAMAPLFDIPLNKPKRGKAPTPEELAEQFIGVLEGGIILARAHKDWKKILKGIQGFRTYLSTLAKNG